MRALTVIVLAGFLAACGGREGYPDLGATPERPEPTLTPERSEELTEELTGAGEEAISHSREGLEQEETEEVSQ